MKNPEKYSKSGKILLENSEKYLESGKILKRNPEKYSTSGKVLVRSKKKRKGPHLFLDEKSGKMLRIRKNAPEESGKILWKIWKIRKNTPENPEKYFPKNRIPYTKSLFLTMVVTCENYIRKD